MSGTESRGQPMNDECTSNTTVPQVVYWFPSRSRCPGRNEDGERCESLNTRADCTRRNVQYRVCLDCGKRYPVRGKPV